MHKPRDLRDLRKLQSLRYFNICVNCVRCITCVECASCVILRYLRKMQFADLKATTRVKNCFLPLLVEHLHALVFVYATTDRLKCVMVHCSKGTDEVYLPHSGDLRGP